MEDKKTSLAYKIIKWFVVRLYPKMEVVGAENIPDGAAIIAANHAQMHGPLGGELHFPGRHYIWCVGQMMNFKEVPAYAFADFWSYKPGYIRWLYKIISYLIAPLSVCLFNNAHTIPVYHDMRLASTFRTTISRLQEDNRVIIFPEHDQKYNNILYDFQDKFIDVARLYYKKTGRELSFVPMYICPAFRKMYLGEPIRFCAENPIKEERRRICAHLMEEITRIASELPEHTVVPYRNVAKKDYPKNTPVEVYTYEEAHS